MKITTKAITRPCCDKGQRLCSIFEQLEHKLAAITMLHHIPGAESREVMLL